MYIIESMQNKNIVTTSPENYTFILINNKFIHEVKEKNKIIINNYQVNYELDINELSYEINDLNSVELVLFIEEETRISWHL